MKSNLPVIGAFLVIIACLIGITFLTLSNRGRGLTTATYNRFEACTLSIPPEARNQVLINKCWAIAENSTGIEVDHFSNVHN